MEGVAKRPKTHLCSGRNRGGTGVEADREGGLEEVFDRVFGEFFYQAVGVLIV